MQEKQKEIAENLSDKENRYEQKEDIGSSDCGCMELTNIAFRGGTEEEFKALNISLHDCSSCSGKAAITNTSRIY